MPGDSPAKLIAVPHPEPLEVDQRQQLLSFRLSERILLLKSAAASGIARRW
jgi:hypothetical protein